MNAILDALSYAVFGLCAATTFVFTTAAWLLMTQVKPPKPGHHVISRAEYTAGQDIQEGDAVYVEGGKIYKA